MPIIRIAAFAAALSLSTAAFAQANGEGDKPANNAAATAPHHTLHHHHWRHHHTIKHEGNGSGGTVPHVNPN